MEFAKFEKLPETSPASETLSSFKFHVALICSMEAPSPVELWENAIAAVATTGAINSSFVLRMNPLACVDDLPNGMTENKLIPPIDGPDV